MSRLVEFPLQDGGTVLVQVDEAAAGPVTWGLGERRLATEQAQQTFKRAIARVHGRGGRVPIGPGGREDVAVLELSGDVPRGARPAVLGHPPRLGGHRFDTYG